MAMRRDLFVIAATLLSHTKKLILGTGIIPTFERVPAVMAAGQQSLDELSGGRFLLGLGRVAPPIVEGCTASSTARRSRRCATTSTGWIAARISRRCSEAPGSNCGLSTGRANRAASGPRGARAEDAGALPRSRAGRRILLHARRAHARRPRDPGSRVWLCPEVKVVLETDPSKARDAARAAGAVNISLENYRKTWRRYGFKDEDFANGGSDRLIDGLVGWGTPAQIERFVRAHLDAGATQVCVQFVNPNGQNAGLHWEAVEALAPVNSGIR
jgi:alkanesulfonate monooxygenase SsuD/methylene tetrahydromethanopterin reductase-like flavin-dependent oxidoreductase (luciferase family)